MKISYEWLQEFLPGLQLSAEELATLFTLHSFETTVVGRRVLDPHIVVVRIEKIEPHPNADRLRLATVTDGQATIRVVCGAPNIAEGDIVPLSPPGTVLYDQEGKQFTLTTASIRGVESPGMLNSLRELGITNSHSGIFILPPGTPLGTRLNEHLRDDVILEADVTNNRAHDCLSHYGIAREVGALLNLPVQQFPTMPLPANAAEVEGFSLDLQGAELVPRYEGIVITGMHPTVSPLWLQARLLAMGTVPKNSIIDVTNYILFECGNPSHAFDVGRLPGKKIGVRTAKSDEQIHALGETTERPLPPDALVVTADDQIVAVAGVVGGQPSAVNDQTENILVEIANFDGVSIQQTMIKLGLRTEAAIRFSKRIDPSLVDQAAGRLLELLQQLAGGTVQGRLTHYPEPAEARQIKFRPKTVNRLAGTRFSPAQIQQSLEALRFTVNKKDEQWVVHVPSDRLDITEERDLIEEVARFIGLENIPTQLLKTPPTPAKLPRAIHWREAIRDACIKWELTEVYNYFFSDERILAKLNLVSADPLTLSNPMAPELRYLRQSLLPGLFNNVLKNKTEFRRVEIFEVGTVFFAGNGGRVEGVVEKLYFSGVVYGIEGAARKLEVLIQLLLTQLGITDVQSKVDLAHPLWGDTAVHLVHRGKLIGTYGEVAPAAQEHLRLHHGVAAFEFNLDTLIELATNEPPALNVLSDQPMQYAPVSKYPPVFRDVSLIVVPDVRIEQVQEIIERAGGKLVVDVDLFDIYDAADTEHDEELGKSVAFHIKYQSMEKTLLDEEVATIHNQIIATLKSELGAQVRE